MSSPDDPSRPTPPTAESLAASLQWTHFRMSFPAALKAQPGAGDATRVDLRAVAHVFWSWVSVLEHDASFEALDPVDHAHFAAGLLLARLLPQRPILLPPLAPDAEARLLTAAVLDRLQGWRRAHGAPAIDGPPVDAQGAHWASFLENTAEEPELAIAFLDEFTGREPEWRYPQLIAERPAMRKARRAERGSADAATG